MEISKENIKTRPVTFETAEGEENIEKFMSMHVGKEFLCRYAAKGLTQNVSYATGRCEMGYRGPLLRYEDGTYEWYYRFKQAILI
jgi:hypothetical protein